MTGAGPKRVRVSPAWTKLWLEERQADARGMRLRLAVESGDGTEQASFALG